MREKWLLATKGEGRRRVKKNRMRVNVPRYVIERVGLEKEESIISCLLQREIFFSKRALTDFSKRIRIVEDETLYVYIYSAFRNRINL